LLRVIEGTVLYHLEPPHDGAQMVSAGESIVIKSGILHRIAFVEPWRFYAEFYRTADPSTKGLIKPPAPM
jgi:hypothetical protein